jgi:hypothetical protein
MRTANTNLFPFGIEFINLFYIKDALNIKRTQIMRENANSKQWDVS